MMNRIILIGNGFDLAHSLLTSYQNFTQWYRTFQQIRLLEDKSCPTDGLCSVQIDNPNDLKNLNRFSWILENPMFRLQRNWQQQEHIKEFDSFFDRLPKKYESPFFEAINRAAQMKGWVD